MSDLLRGSFFRSSACPDGAVGIHDLKVKVRKACSGFPGMQQGFSLARPEGYRPTMIRPFMPMREPSISSGFNF
jgi:hypothetical protein